MRKGLLQSLVVIALLLVTTSAFAAFVLGTKTHTKPHTSVMQSVQSSTGLTTVQDVFAAQNVYNYKNIVVSVENTSGGGRALTHLGIWIAQDVTWTKALDLTTVSGMWGLTNDCTDTLADATKCYMVLPADLPIYALKVTASAGGAANLTVTVTGRIAGY